MNDTPLPVLGELELAVLARDADDSFFAAGQWGGVPPAPGDLVIIESLDEKNFLHGPFESFDMWLGAHDPDGDFDYEWIDGVEEPSCEVHPSGPASSGLPSVSAGNQSAPRVRLTSPRPAPTHCPVLSSVPSSMPNSRLNLP